LKKFNLTSKVICILFAALPLGVSAFELPTHFSNTIGSALLCQSQIDSYFFTDYMNTYFGKPTKTEGGAYWWPMKGTLYGTKLDSIFVSQESTTSVFIGAVFIDPPETLLQNILNSTGIIFKATQDPEKWSSSSFSVIVKYHQEQTPSKMYCFK
jgi:hypothetical protein